MRALPLIFFPGLLALVCSAGCGLKGPLYLPTAEQERETAEREAALEERERRERDAKTAPTTRPTPAPTQPPKQTNPAAVQPSPTGAPAN